MHETLTHSSTLSEAPSGIEAEALRAEAWAGEPFMRSDEDAAIVLAPGTAFRKALDDALAEMEAELHAPSPEWKTARAARPPSRPVDRKSTRLNSSHQIISDDVFCLQK